MARKRYIWKLKERELTLGDRTQIAGLLDLAEASPAGGARPVDPEVAFARALQLEQDGADIIEIAPDPFLPGTRRLPEGEEMRRLIPVLKQLRGKLVAPLAVVTWQSAVAEKALALGAEILVDPSGLTLNAELPRVATRHDSGFVINHMRGSPEAWAKLPPLADPVNTILHELEAAVHRALHAGLRSSQIVIDPGLDMGKRKDENLRVLAHLSAFRRLDFPLCLHPSRKAFLGQKTIQALRQASLAAAVAAAIEGAHLVRLHDVAEALPALAVADAIQREE
jgi:dihydropteroate synthase